MSYLKFDKSRMINLEYSLSREILRTNRKGAYHCTTLVECNTRKQHGLLVMPISEVEHEPNVLLSSFDETVIQHGAEFNLGLHKYDGDNYSPRGHKYIREFDCDSTPKTIYRVGGVILSKEKIFSLTDNNIMIRYTLLDAHSQTTLRFRPFLAFRHINSLTSENDQINKAYSEIENGISTCLYDGYPNLFMQFNKKNEFKFDPKWYKGVEYLHDQQDGFAYKEDLYVPGFFELTIKKGESIIFSAGDKKVGTRGLKQFFADEIERHTPRSSFFNCLKNSANQFHFKTEDGQRFLLSDYPWYSINARQQFIALPGLTLSIDKIQEFQEVMDSSISAINNYMKEGKLDSTISNMDDPDVLLWAVRALTEFAHYDKSKCYEKYGKLVHEIVTFIQNNKHPNLKMLENGLITTNGKDKPVSWMNKTAMGKPITPRTGCLVEFNALWYNAAMFELEIQKETQENIKLINDLEKLTGLIKESFQEVFVNEWGYLFDYVDGGIVDWSVRPNMIFAVSLDYSPLTRAQGKSVLEYITKELLTSRGLRTLSPKSEGYRPYYVGSNYDKDYAYSNGTSWPWLLGPFLKAYLKIHQFSGISFVDRILVGMEEEMYNDCVGSLSELYDGNPPFTGRGASSSAVNVAHILNILKMKQRFEQYY